LDEAGAIAQLNSSGDEEEPPIVDEHTVAEVISDWASIPLGKLESGEMDRLISLEDDMTQRVKGQGRAIQAVARAVRRARSGLRDPNRPIASFMFCGPTGTGKVRTDGCSSYYSTISNSIL
jgi:ATP-dependent Clp protease ATP-binding subunit ClpA